MPALPPRWRWIALLACSLASSAQADTTPIVVAAGVNRSFDTRLPALSYAETDAERFVHTMATVGDVLPSDITLLKSPTADEFVESVRRMVASRTRVNDVRLILYFSGHADDRGLHFRGSALDRRSLHKLLDEVKASTKVAIIDSCFSGWVAAKGVATTAPFPLPKLDLDELTGSVFLTAASAREVAYESDELSGSVFTHHLLSGLNGAGDANDDGLVTVDELYQYVYRETRVRSLGYPTAAPQRPEYHADLHGRGALVLSRPRRGIGKLQVDPGVLGSVSLASMNGLGNLTVFGDGFTTREFAIPEGSYRAVIRRGDRIGEAGVVIARGEDTWLRPQQFEWRTTDALIAETSKGLSPDARKNASISVISARQSVGSAGYSGYLIERGGEVLSMTRHSSSIGLIATGGLGTGKGVISGESVRTYEINASVYAIFANASDAARGLIGISEALQQQQWMGHDHLEPDAVAERTGNNHAVIAGCLLPISRTRIGDINLALRWEYAFVESRAKQLNAHDFLTVGIATEPP